MKMVNLFVSAVIALLINPTALAAGQFPTGPDKNLTPGALCERATELRYPEKIKYCERDVNSSTKREIFADYDRLGYRTQQMNRMAFKIDHYIPLCAGGSNAPENLWPQHQSVYNITDPLEPLICEKMAAGRLKQAEAIRIIKAAKNDLSSVKDWIEKVNAL